MNVASLEKCKELYELSGWKDSSHTWVIYNQPAVGTQLEPEVIPSEISLAYYNLKSPAYDLGYLLRKLYEVRNGLVVYHRHHDMKWEAFYAGKNFEYDYLVDIELDDHWLVVADTPEDAAAKLAIELFKQGILTK